LLPPTGSKSGSKLRLDLLDEAVQGVAAKVPSSVDDHHAVAVVRIEVRRRGRQPGIGRKEDDVAIIRLDEWLGPCDVDRSVLVPAAGSASMRKVPV
jgi:hypothetical protein